MRVNYAIVFVSDMTRAVRFYRDTLGLLLRFESPHWTEFATDGATLALHDAGEPVRNPLRLTNRSQGSAVRVSRCQTSMSFTNG